MVDPAVLLQQLAESASAKEHARRELQRELKQVEMELQALTQSPSTSSPRRQRQLAQHEEREPQKHLGQASDRTSHGKIQVVAHSTYHNQSLI